MEFKRTNLLPEVAKNHGPDVLRPGSSTSRHGQGHYAFIYTKHEDESGRAKGGHLFVWDASVGHEDVVIDPDVMKAMFGADYEEVKKVATDPKPIYSYDPETVTYKEIGQTTEVNHWKVRDQARQYDNLFGRSGNIKGYDVIMLWWIPEDNGWHLVDETAKLLNLGDNTLVVNMTDEVGLLKDIRNVLQSKKNLPPSQEEERFKALSRYHVATGAEKEALKRKYGFGGQPVVSTNVPPEERETYPWSREDWRKKGKELGVPAFDYGESVL